MDSNLINKELGSEGNLSLKIEGGKLKLSLKYDSSGADAELSVLLEPDYFIDKLAGVIPGQIDDAIFAILKGALKG